MTRSQGFICVAGEAALSPCCELIPGLLKKITTDVFLVIIFTRKGKRAPA